MKRGFLILVLLAGLPSGVWAKDGQAVFDAACAACHFKQRDPARRDEMVAPPMEMMAVHVRDAVGGQRDAFVARVVDFVKAPAESKAVDAMAVSRFGLMPAIGDSFPELTDDDLRLVAHWMFDTFAQAQLPPEEQRRGQRP
ncbi:MAG: c-type cytochrome [Magnetospirillum sp.]|nr:c-type cytochrome [Magnetospirillum sp.]